jgi:hypothetical protein
LARAVLKRGSDAELGGDYRDEIVCAGSGRAYVYTNIDPIHKREVARLASREYRQWLACNCSAGCHSYFGCREFAFRNAVRSFSVQPALV